MVKKKIWVNLFPLYFHHSFSSKLGRGKYEKVMVILIKQWFGSMILRYSSPQRIPESRLICTEVVKYSDFLQMEGKFDILWVINEMWFLTCIPSGSGTAGPWATLIYLTLIIILWAFERKEKVLYILLWHSQILIQRFA